MAQKRFKIGINLRSKLEKLKEDATRKVHGGIKILEPQDCGAYCEVTCAHYCHAQCEAFCGNIAYKA
jgi:hypothetical protein